MEILFDVEDKQICCEVKGNINNFTETNMQLHIDENWWKEKLQSIVTYYCNKFKLEQNSSKQYRLNLNFLKTKKDNWYSYYEREKTKFGTITLSLNTFDDSKIAEFYICMAMYQWMLDTWGKQIDYSHDDRLIIYRLSVYFALCYCVNNSGKSELARLVDCVDKAGSTETAFLKDGYSIFFYSQTSYEGSGKYGSTLPDYRKLIAYLKYLEDFRTSMGEEDSKAGRTSKMNEVLDKMLGNKRKIDSTKKDNFNAKYSPKQLKEQIKRQNGYGEAALSFLWENIFETYNREWYMDEDNVALYIAVANFLKTGSKEDAFDVYSAYADRYFPGDKMQEFINFISSYENNASRLVNKHRDHYSHSVYVFILGLALFKKSKKFKKAFEDKYIDLEKYRFQADLFIYKNFDTNNERFMRLWGLTALFHDIGYQLEIPFNQITENTKFTFKGEEKRQLYYQYVNVDKFTELEPFFKECENDGCWKTEHLKWFDVDGNGYLEYRQKLVQNTRSAPERIEDVFADHICRALNKNKDRSLDPDVVSEELKKKATPKEFYDEDDQEYKCFMDHAYFSAILLFKQMIRMYGIDGFVNAFEEKTCLTKDYLYQINAFYDSKRLPTDEQEKFVDSLYTMNLNEWMDAITAIVMHNKFFELVLKKKSKKSDVSLAMNEQPLAYLLMLCDEIQCWDRTSFGKKSISEMHPIDFKFEFDDSNEIFTGKYVFDINSIEGAINGEKEVLNVKKGTIKKFFQKKNENYDKDNKDKGPKYIEYSPSDINWKDETKKSPDPDKPFKKSDYSRNCKFVTDINKIVSVDNKDEIILKVAVEFGNDEKESKRTLSEISMRHLYEMSEKLYMKKCKEDNQKHESGKNNDKPDISLLHEEFKDLDAWKKLRYVTFVKYFGEGLNEIGCFYSNQKLMFDQYDIGNDDIDKISKIEKEHLDYYCDSHILEKIKEDEVKDWVAYFVSILKDEDALTVYKLP